MMSEENPYWGFIGGLADDVVGANRGGETRGGKNPYVRFLPAGVAAMGQAVAGVGKLLSGPGSGRTGGDAWKGGQTQGASAVDTEIDPTIPRVVPWPSGQGGTSPGAGGAGSDADVPKVVRPVTVQPPTQVEGEGAADGPGGQDAWRGSAPSTNHLLGASKQKPVEEMTGKKVLPIAMPMNQTPPGGWGGAGMDWSQEAIGNYQDRAMIPDKRPLVGRLDTQAKPVSPEGKKALAEIEAMNFDEAKPASPSATPVSVVPVSGGMSLIEGQTQEKKREKAMRILMSGVASLEAKREAREELLALTGKRVNGDGSVADAVARLEPGVLDRLRGEGRLSRDVTEVDRRVERQLWDEASFRQLPDKIKVERINEGVERLSGGARAGFEWVSAENPGDDQRARIAARLIVEGLPGFELIPAQDRPALYHAMMLKLRGITEDDFVRLMRRRSEGDRSWWESVVGSSVSGLMSSGSGLVRGTQYLGPLGPLRLAAHYLGYRTPEDFVAEYLKEGSEYVSDGLVNPEYRYSNGVAGALGAAAPYIAGAAVLPAGLPAGAAELLMGLVGGSAAGAEAYERGKARGMQGEELAKYVATNVLIDGVSTAVMAKGALPGGSVSGRVAKSTPLGKAAAEMLEKSAGGRVAGTALGHTADNVVTGQARQRLSNYVERLFGNTEVGTGDNTKETLVNDLFVGWFSTLPKLPKAWRGYEVAGKARVDLDKPLEVGEAEPVEKPVPVPRMEDGRVSFEEPENSHSSNEGSLGQPDPSGKSENGHASFSASDAKWKTDPSDPRGTSANDLKLSPEHYRRAAAFSKDNPTPSYAVGANQLLDGEALSIAPEMNPRQQLEAVKGYLEAMRSETPQMREARLKRARYPSFAKVQVPLRAIAENGLEVLAQPVSGLHGSKYLTAKDIPWIVEQLGLPQINTNMNLGEHIRGQKGDSAFRGLTTQPGSGADSFYKGAAYHAGPGGLVFDIDGAPGWDPQLHARNAVKNLRVGEGETTTLAGTSLKHIKRIGIAEENSKGLITVIYWISIPDLVIHKSMQK